MVVVIPWYKKGTEQTNRKCTRMFLSLWVKKTSCRRNCRPWGSFFGSVCRLCYKWSETVSEKEFCTIRHGGCTLKHDGCSIEHNGWISMVATRVFERIISLITESVQPTILLKEDSHLLLIIYLSVVNYWLCSHIFNNYSMDIIFQTVLNK